MAQDDLAAPLGRAELELLQHIDARQPVTVGDAARMFGQPRGLARTTVQTMMERLTAKGFLSRQRIKTVYHYRPARPATKVVTGMVAEFVHRVLGGSVSPFFAYLSQQHGLSDAEVAQLRAIADRLETDVPSINDPAASDQGGGER